MEWRSDRRAEPVLLAVQFVVCVVSWTLVVLLIDGVVRQAGFLASVVTGVVLVVVTWALVKLGWLPASERAGNV